MIEIIIIVLAGLLIIAGSTALSPRLGVASPLILVAIGVTASFLPVFESTHIDPELILAGVLPPLLYSAAVSMPTMNFRREFGAISGLSVLLVIATALLLGLFFHLVVPGIGFAWGVALGAIISPTDAVATSIIKQTASSRRVIAILEGESLLNDASALVLLRTAIAATAAAFSVWGAVGSFIYSIAVAIGLGLLTGWLTLRIRRQLTDPAVSTLLSFTVPFIASVPAELLGASGLVAAVVAGLFTGIRAPRVLSPRHRLSDSQNWRTIELVLEGAVFLTMGVQLKSILSNVQQDHAGVGTALAIALGALVLTVIVRAAYVAPLLGILAQRARRGAEMKDHLHEMRDRMIETGVTRMPPEEKIRGRRSDPEHQHDRITTRFVMLFADIEYFLREPLGWREGTVIVWAGMRGAVTVAAAQTLPSDTPQRSVLVLIAYTVAALSLLIQGGTVGALLRAMAPRTDRSTIDNQVEAERTEIMELLRKSAEAVPEPAGLGDRSQAGFQASLHHRLAVIAAQRSALLDARDHGVFDADLLANALVNLDADQIAIELRGAPPE